MTKKIIPILSFFLLCFVAVDSMAQKKTPKKSKKTELKLSPQQIARFDFLINRINTILKSEHYHFKPIDDTFSKQVFDEFIKTQSSISPKYITIVIN